MVVVIATFRDMLYEIYGVSNQTEKFVFLGWVKLVRHCVIWLEVDARIEDSTAIRTCVEPMA